MILLLFCILHPEQKNEDEIIFFNRVNFIRDMTIIVAVRQLRDGKKINLTILSLSLQQLIENKYFSNATFFMF